jgi:Flp pilus assembly protein TadG
MSKLKLNNFARRVRGLWLSHRADERGVTSLEFVFSATLFMFILFWTIETGFIMARWVMLERGVDIAARDLRINGLPSSLQDGEGNVSNQVAHQYIKDMICAETTLISDCDNVLFVELTTIDATTGLPNTAAQCVDRTGPVDPATDLPTVDAGSRGVADSSDLMYLRACVVVDPILPANYSMPLPYDTSGGVALIVDSAFVNEPE